MKKKGVHVFVQARLTSKRLPNKVLRKLINNETSISLINKRLKNSKYIEKIIFIIPNNNKNLKLKNYMKKNNFEFFVGDEKNVFSRYYDAANHYKSNVIIRITADCPLIDSKITDKIIRILNSGKYDYVTNTYPPSFPDGLDVEAFTRKSLNIASKIELDEYQKEHVTPIFRQNKKFKVFNYLNDINQSNIRLTLDNDKDFQKLKKIFKTIKNFETKPWIEIKKLISKEKFINLLNVNQKQSENSLSPYQKWKYAKSIIPDGNMLVSKRPNVLNETIWPNYFKKTKSCFVWGIDNKKYLDAYLMGVGTNTLGYSNREIDDAVKKNINSGNMSSLNCYEEVLLAEQLIDIHPWGDMVKFTRSGGEANAVAIRIARSNTSRTNVAICGYHGWHDWYLAANINNNSNLNNHLKEYLIPLGVPKQLKNTVYSFEYNNFKDFKEKVEKNNIGIVKMEVTRFDKPQKNFLKKIREYTKRRGIILIFDECTTGFRNNFGGIHLKYNIQPDIAIFGKALGNGYAINAIIGKKEIMENTSKTFISSTFWTERIGPTAALKTLEVMKKIKSWDLINKNGELIRKYWLNISKRNNLEIEIQGLNSIIEFKIKNANIDFKNFLLKHFLKKKILGSNRIYTCIDHNKKNLDIYFNELDNAFNKLSLK